MKQYLYSAALLLAAVATHAQSDPNTAADAVRFAQDNLTGTARFRAMSGAFGAVGGDLSAINVNPAGSAVFNYNSGTGSLTNFNVANTSTYFGSKYKHNDSSLDLNQLGAVFVFNNTAENATWNKFALAINYENTNNFDNSLFSAGTSPQSAIDAYFLKFANGIPLGTLTDAYYEDLDFAGQQAYLGYNAYVFNPSVNASGNTTYASAVPAGSTYQENSLVTRGYNGKVALNIAGQLKDIFYVGANLNIHFTDLVKTTSYYEEFGGAAADDLQWVQFDNERYTYGGGFSFNVGAIAKITEEFRFGLAYESPTWMRLQDELTQRIASNVGGDFVSTDPGITILLDDYTLKTPSKVTGSLAYVFGKSGLISFDYSRKDYSKTEFSGSRYSTINTELSDNLQAANEFRVGAEYRIKNVSLRGGYRFENSPYKDTKVMSDLNGFSGGLGFAFGNSRLDLAYSWFKRKMDIDLLALGLGAANVNSNNNNITLSYTIDL